MASDPSSESDVGKRTSIATTSVMVMGTGTDSGLEWGSGIGVPEGGGLGHPWELASYLNR